MGIDAAVDPGRRGTNRVATWLSVRGSVWWGKSGRTAVARVCDRRKQDSVKQV